MSELQNWAARWGVSDDAVADLLDVAGVSPEICPPDLRDKSEKAVSNAERLAAARGGGVLYRNNVGSFYNERGTPVRYGLANESKKQNQVVKSSDLIGITPVRVTPQHVGLTLGVFTAVETKRADWQFGKKDAEHDLAQLRFILIVLRHGGFARFSSWPALTPQV